MKKIHDGDPINNPETASLNPHPQNPLRTFASFASFALSSSSPPSSSHALAELQARLRACRLCQDAGHIAQANPIFAGRHDDPIYLIGQAPGAISHHDSIPFNGPSGKVLTAWLVRAGFPASYFRDHVY